ncbi:flagellar assembly protein FliH [Bacillus spongiae]|uniref:Flagellar assembly protein FliH n=1 Tax=Bacillus spongiae TaxID=2683610 RepID=A0ABU8HA89_9BACI
MSRIFKSRQTSAVGNPSREISLKRFSTTTNEQKEEERKQNHIQLLEEAKQEALRIIEEAESHKLTIINEVNTQKQEFKSQCELALQQARKEGYDEGFRQGKEESISEYQNLIVEGKQVVESSKVEFRRHIESAEKLILKTAIKCAERILGKKLKEDPKTFVSIVKRGLKEAVELKEVQIHVHPSNHDLLTEYDEEIRRIIAPNAHYYLYPNEDISETECIIESNQGRIIVSLDSQLQQLQIKLMELLEGEQ